MSAHRCGMGFRHLVCTLHEGHKGSHYDSLRDESFEVAYEYCRGCGAPDGDCVCAEREEEEAA